MLVQTSAAVPALRAGAWWPLNRAQAKTRGCQLCGRYRLVVSPAEAKAAADELYEFYGRVSLSPAAFADGVGLGYKLVLGAIHSGELPAVAGGTAKDGSPSKPYSIFRCHAGDWFARHHESRRVARTTAERKFSAAERTKAAAGPSGVGTPARTRSRQRPAAVALVTRERS